MKNNILLIGAKIFDKFTIFTLLFLLVRTNIEEYSLFSYNFAVVSVLFVIFNLGGEFYQTNYLINKGRFIDLAKSKFWLFLITLGGSLLFIHSAGLFLILLLSSFYIESIIIICRSQLYIKKKFKTDAYLLLLEKTVFILILVFNFLTINSIFFYYLSFLISKVISLYFYFYLTNERSVSFNPKFKSLNIYKNAWSYAFHSLLVILFVQLDVIMLKELSSLKEVGIYASATRVYFASLIIAEILAKQYYPHFCIIYNSNNSPLYKVAKQSLITSSAVGLVIGGFILLFSEEIIYTLFGSEFYKSSTILLYLGILVVIRYSMVVYSNIIAASPYNKLKVYVSIICVVINIVLNFILIPKYNSMGALMATLATEIFLLGAYIYIVDRYCHIKLIKENIILVLFILIFTAVIWVDLSILNFIPLAISFLCLIWRRNEIKQFLNFVR